MSGHESIESHKIYKHWKRALDPVRHAHGPDCVDTHLVTENMRNLRVLKDIIELV